MNKSVAIIGMGEMGGVFARGFLRSGYPVYPINRNDDLEKIKNELPELEAVIVAVGEKDLHATLDQIPSEWSNKLVLLQNELLPNDWKSHNIANPTVISVWFEKKQPNDYKVIIPSPVFGPLADLVKSSLESINISVNVMGSIDELVFELVVKNLYILTTNISGLEVGGNVGQLWNDHNNVAREVAQAVLDIQFKLIDAELDREQLINSMVKAFDGDLEHKCMGRSAPARLERALKLSEEFGLDAEKLKSIAAGASSAS